MKLRKKHVENGTPIYDGAAELLVVLEADLTNQMEVHRDRSRQAPASIKDESKFIRFT